MRLSLECKIMLMSGSQYYCSLLEHWLTIFYTLVQLVPRCMQTFCTRCISCCIVLDSLALDTWERSVVLIEHLVVINARMYGVKNKSSIGWNDEAQSTVEMTPCCPPPIPFMCQRVK